eukprot:2124212-Amphidinium_carterae.1
MLRFMHAGGIISDMLARSTASILSSSASARGASRDHCGSRDGRAETADCQQCAQKASTQPTRTAPQRQLQPLIAPSSSARFHQAL